MTKQNNIDKLFEASLRDYKPQPTFDAWDKLSAQMDAAENSAAEFDNMFEQAFSDDIPLMKATSWAKMEQELDAIDAQHAKRKRRIGFYFSIASIAASLLFIISNYTLYSPDIPSSNNSTTWQYQAEYSPVGEKTNTTNNIANPLIINNSTGQILAQDFISNSQQLKPKSSTPSQNSAASIQSKSYPNASMVKKTAVSKATNSPTKNTEKANNQDNSFDSQIDNATTHSLAQFAPLYFDSPIDIKMELNDIQSIHFKSLNSATSFSLDVYYAPEFIIDNTPVQDVDYPSLSTKKSTNVFSDYSLGMNLKFHYNNIFVQSGFSFGSFIEDINYNILNELHDTSASYYTYEIKTTHTYDTIGWTDDPLQAGVIVPILRSNINTDTLNSTWNKVDSVSYVLGDKKIENRYKYIEIPLMLGYQHQFGNWKISFGMGAAYGFKVAENGTNTIDNDGFITKITNVKTPYFDNRINGIVSLGLSYSISPQLSLILQPTYRTNLMSANDKSLAYHNFSLRAGLNYKL